MSGKNLIISRNPAKKRRSAAQKAASKRNIKKAQAATRRGRRRAPAKRRRTSTRKRSYKRRSNPGFRLPSVNRIINDQVIPALWGGAGAVGNDMLLNVLPLPPEWKSGWMRHLSKAVGAIAIGVLGSVVLPKRIADNLGAGAMTVVGYNVVRDLAAQFMPNLQLGEYLEMGEYLDPALGYYGAGLNPEAIPGSGLDVGNQFTRGTPYIDPGLEVGLEAWPTGGAYSDIEGEY